MAKHFYAKKTHAVAGILFYKIPFQVQIITELLLVTDEVAKMYFAKSFVL